MLKMSHLALDASTKMSAPLLHCSINDVLTVDQQNPTLSEYVLKAHERP